MTNVEVDDALPFLSWYVNWNHLQCYIRLFIQMQVDDILFYDAHISHNSSPIYTGEFVLITGQDHLDSLDILTNEVSSSPTHGDKIIYTLYHVS